MYTTREQKLEAALILCLRMIDEALPLFNWGASALNANAFALLNEAPIAVRRALAEKIQIDVALSPEAVAQMVADLTTKAAIINMGEKIAWGSDKLCAEAADMLTTIAAENATLRASEAAALERIAELEAAACSYQAALLRQGIDGSKGPKE